MTQATIAVGKDIIAFCSKCNMSLSHIVVALKNSKTPAKVKCNTCQAIHAFKDPNKAAKPRKKSGRGRSRAPETPIVEVWNKALKDSKVQARPYSIKAKFSIGDVITHSIFGPGVVQSIVDNNKIEVLFESSVKHLVHCR